MQREEAGDKSEKKNGHEDVACAMKRIEEGKENKDKRMRRRKTDGYQRGEAKRKVRGRRFL